MARSERPIENNMSTFGLLNKVINQKHGLFSSSTPLQTWETVKLLFKVHMLPVWFCLKTTSLPCMSWSRPFHSQKDGNLESMNLTTYVVLSLVSTRYTVLICCVLKTSRHHNHEVSQTITQRMYASLLFCCKMSDAQMHEYFQNFSFISVMTFYLATSNRCSSSFSRFKSLNGANYALLTALQSSYNTSMLPSPVAAKVANGIHRRVYK
jgi:hypothetical protein